jgi:hypothetical protein
VLSAAGCSHIAPRIRALSQEGVACIRRSAIRSARAAPVAVQRQTPTAGLISCAHLLDVRMSGLALVVLDHVGEMVPKVDFYAADDEWISVH